jgi:tetratricopeptide (TPR) repeat protein
VNSFTLIRQLFPVFLLICPMATLAGADSVSRILEQLHQGRFLAAETEIAGFPSDSRAARAEKSFLSSFTTYWKVLYDARASLFLGSAHLLRAQLRAAEKKVLLAAYEAKKSRKMLLRALDESGSGPDSCFGLGTYEYYADQLPAIVKGLRFLLFIPGGNRELGLRRLERAAGQGSLFRFEARVVLLTIYAGSKEHLYDDALRHAGLLLEEQDRSVTALHAVAKLYMSLGRPDQASDLLEEALKMAISPKGTADEVLAALYFQAAQAEYRRFRPEAATVHLDWLLKAGRILPEGMVREAQDLLQRSHLMEIAGKGSALKRMMYGRQHLLEGDHEQAGRLFSAALASDSLPSEFRDRCRLLAGQASDLAGNRAAARRWYREADREDASVLYLTRAFTIQDGF